ncbi:MAG: hypothetical protein WBF75_19465 [Pseudonocardiaceae bacterium]
MAGRAFGPAGAPAWGGRVAAVLPALPLERSADGERAAVQPRRAVRRAGSPTGVVLTAAVLADDLDVGPLQSERFPLPQSDVDGDVDDDVAVETADIVFAADRYELRYVMEIK